MDSTSSADPTDDGAQRFSRQVRFAAFGSEGQQRLRGSRVAIAGVGGLGSTLASHLVRAGAGAVVLIDRDLVECSNLPRQALFTDRDARLGLPKAEAAAAHLREIGGPSRIETRVKDLSARTAEELLADADLVLDGLDNFEGRYLLNDFCRQRAIPWIYGGAVGSTGAVLLVPGRGGACLRCLFPVGPEPGEAPTCETAGVLTPLPALVASLQACEALRWFSGLPGGPRLWQLDPFTGRAWSTPASGPAASCPVCARTDYPALREEEDSLTTRLCGRGVVQVLPGRDCRLDLAAYARRWQGLGEVHPSRFLVRLEVEGAALSLFPDGRALIQGADTEERARALYARYVGC